MACGRDLSLPSPGTTPTITAFTPSAAFSHDSLYVSGDHFDPAGNQLTFPGGAVALAEQQPDGGDLLVDGQLVFSVPEGLEFSGPLLLSNTRGRSQPSVGTFSPLGVGHPNFGTPVSQLRFRLNPVGLVDQRDNVLMAASSFDLLLTDGKAFRRPPGRPLALVRSTQDATHAYVSVRTSAGGVFLEVKAENGDVVGTSAETDVRELFILPPDAAVADSVARTVGIDLAGRTWLTQWRNTAGTLTPLVRRVLPFAQVLGAAALGSTVVMVARGSTSADFVPNVFSVTPMATTVLWAPSTGSACNTSVGIDAACRPPDGPLAVLRSSMNAADPVVIVASLSSGDLLVKQGTDAPHIITLISYATISGMTAGASPNKLVLTKAHDGAVFQYDVSTGSQDWAVQLRGEPSVIDVNAGIDEIAVGNSADNAVDTIAISTGQWTGRIAFDLGLGSANGMLGGIVAPYTYDPARYDEGAAVLERMDLLMRNAGLVVSLNASSLEVFEHAVLEPTAGEPLRLVVTKDFKTVVVHTHAMGVLERDAVGTRIERIATVGEQPTPLNVHALPSGPLLLQTVDTVRTYSWTNGRLIAGTEFPAPPNTTLVGTALAGDTLLIVWRTTRGYGGGFFKPSELKPGGAPEKSLSFDPELSQYVGVVELRDGPAVLFAKQGTGGAAAVPFASLRGDGPAVPSIVSRPHASRASPDGRFMVWLDEGSDQPMARLVRADVNEGSLGTRRIAWVALRQAQSSTQAANGCSCRCHSSTRLRSCSESTEAT